MVTRFSVQDIDNDSETYARSCHVRLGTGRVSFDVPCRAGMGKNTDAEIYEAYRRLSPKVVNSSLESEPYCRKVDNDLRGRCKGRFNMLVVDYDGGDHAAPSPQVVEFLSDMQYSHSDIVVSPSWFSLVTGQDSTDVDLYIRMTDEFLRASSVLNHKPVVVSVPQSIPPNRIGMVLDHFIESDVTSFCIDSHGRSLMNGTWMRKFQTSLERSKEEYAIEGESLLFSINAFQGQIRRNERFVEAKDFLGFSAGMDVICGKHTNGYGRNDDSGDGTVVRMFQPDTYRYTKEQCNGANLDSMKDASNMRQMAEMPNIRRSIHEGDLRSLLESKNLPDTTMGTIFGMRGHGRASTLDDFI